MSFFKKAFGAGSIFKKQAMPNVQGFFKKGGAGERDAPARRASRSAPSFRETPNCVCAQLGQVAPT